MAIIPVFLTLAWAAVGQGGALGSAKVAVVDIPVVSEQYQKTKDLEAAFEQRRVQFNAQRDGLKDKMDRTNRSLQEEFKPGSAEHDERKKQLAVYEVELQWFVETEGQRIEEELAKSLRVIYNDIHTVVQQVAEEHGIDVVLAADRLPQEAARSATQARQQIVLQKVVYWNPRVELTDEVIKKLNEKYKTQTTGSAGPGASPPATQEPKPKGQTPQGPNRP